MWLKVLITPSVDELVCWAWEKPEPSYLFFLEASWPPVPICILGPLFQNDAYSLPKHSFNHPGPIICSFLLQNSCPTRAWGAGWPQQNWICGLLPGFCQAPQPVCEKRAAGVWAPRPATSYVHHLLVGLFQWLQSNYWRPVHYWIQILNTWHVQGGPRKMRKLA